MITKIAILILGASMVMSSAQGQIGNEEILLPSSGNAAIQPLNIKKTADGGFVIGGSISGARQGWASKINADRSVAWTYYHPLAAAEQQSLDGRLVAPTFSAVEPMPDGSVFLCGTQPRPPRSNLPSALLVHLDKAGKVISEKTIEIDNPAVGNNLYHFDDCISWEGGIAVIGHEEHMPPAGAGRAISKTSYVLMSFDARGNLNWKKMFLPLSEEFHPDPGRTSLKVVGSSLMLLETDGVTTELMKFERNGEIEVSRKVDGAFAFVDAFSQGPGIGLFGSLKPVDSPPVLLNLDKKLNELKRLSGESSIDFIPRKVVQLSNNSYVVFGSNINHTGPRLTSGVRLVGPDLKNISQIKIDHDDLYDIGTIQAVELEKPNSFIFARPYAKKVNEKGDVEVGGKKGVLVNFFKLNEE